MPNELNIALATTGLTVTAQRYQAGAAVGSAISCPETGSTGFYSGNMTGAAGTYQVAFLASGANVGSGSIVWSGTAEVPASTFNPASDTVATVTTLTNAPTVPTPSQIASQVRTELATELARVDVATSTRLAGSAYTAPANSDIAAIKSKTDNLPSDPADQSLVEAAISAISIPTPASASAIASAVWAAADKTGYSLTSAERTAIATAVESSILNEGDGQAVLNAIVGAIGNSNVDQVAIVAAIRSDLERTGGKIDSIPTSSAPSASTVAGAVRTELATELGRIDASVSSRLAPSGTLATVTNLTNAPASVTPSDIWSHASRTLTTSSGPTAIQIRQEIDANSTKLDASVSSRMAASEASKIDSVKAKTDALNTERLANVATTAIVGNLIAQANS